MIINVRASYRPAEGTLSVVRDAGNRLASEFNEPSGFEVDGFSIVTNMKSRTVDVKFAVDVASAIPETAVRELLAGVSVRVNVIDTAGPYAYIARGLAYKRINGTWVIDYDMDDDQVGQTLAQFTHGSIATLVNPEGHIIKGPVNIFGVAYDIFGVDLREKLEDGWTVGQVGFTPTA